MTVHGVIVFMQKRGIAQVVGNDDAGVQRLEIQNKYWIACVVTVLRREDHWGCRGVEWIHLLGICTVTNTVTR